MRFSFFLQVSTYKSKCYACTDDVFLVDEFVTVSSLSEIKDNMVANKLLLGCGPSIYIVIVVLITLIP